MTLRSLPAELGLPIIDCIGAEADLCYYARLSEVEYPRLRTLCSCALVCKDWLHQSRINLYRTIFIKSVAKFDSLESTFHRNPSFRDFVHTVHVTPFSEILEEPRVSLGRALLFLRTMHACTTDLVVSDDIPLDNVTRRCLSLGYPHIVHLHLSSMRYVPENRFRYLLNAFPSLRIVSYYVAMEGDIQPYALKYSIDITQSMSRRASSLPEKNVGQSIYKMGFYPAYILRHSLGILEIRGVRWLYNAHRYLDFSKLPLLHALILHMYCREATPSIEAVAKLLRHREPCGRLRSLILVLHDAFNSNYKLRQEWARTLPTSSTPQEENFHILCNEIDCILGDEQHDSEVIATSLTLKFLNALSTRTANHATSALQARFPKLHHRGSLKIDLRIDCSLDDLYCYEGHIIASPSGQFIARNRVYKYSSPSDRTVVVWDSRSRTILSEIEANQALGFIPSPDGHDHYIVLMKEKSLVVWDHSCGTLIATLPSLSPNSQKTSNVCWWRAIHVSHNLIICETISGFMFVWEGRGFTLLYKYEPPNSCQINCGPVHIVCESADGNWLLTNAYNLHLEYDICLWHAVTRTWHPVLPHHENRDAHFQVDAAFWEDGTSIVLACHCGAVERRDFRTRMPLRNTYLVDSTGGPVHKLDRNTTHLSPDGRRICWISDAKGDRRGQIVNMSDADTGSLLWSTYIERPVQYHREVFFSPNGQYVAYLNPRLNTLLCWRAVDGRYILDEKTKAASCEFSRNAKVLAWSPESSWDDRNDEFHIMEL